mmetsp:Transcript_17387/g.43718  ORF Transcript_17387/g.43718 Transcript_17387/m.43718 type:complete len:265 (-) Transcript_17387:369-1163(-)
MPWKGRWLVYSSHRVMPNAYISAALDMRPSSRISGAMWVSVPWNMPLMCVSVCSMRTASPKSATLQRSPRPSLPALDSMTLRALRSACSTLLQCRCSMARATSSAVSTTHTMLTRLSAVTNTPRLSASRSDPLSQNSMTRRTSQLVTPPSLVSRNSCVSDMVMDAPGPSSPAVVLSPITGRTAYVYVCTTLGCDRSLLSSVSAATCSGSASSRLACSGALLPLPSVVMAPDEFERSRPPSSAALGTGVANTLTAQLVVLRHSPW